MKESIRESMIYGYMLSPINESKNQDANVKIRKYITDKYPWYFIHIYTLEGTGTFSKTTTKIDIVGFKEKVDPKYKKFSLGAIVNYNKDKCKTLLSDYTIKGSFTIDKDLKKYTSFNSIFKSSSSKESIQEGLFDRFKKKKKEEKKEDKKPVNKETNFTPPQALSKDSEEYKDRVAQYNEVYKTVEKVVNKYKSKYGGMGIYKNQDDYEEYLDGFLDEIEIVIGSINEMKDYNKIKDLPEKEYREEANKLYDVVNKVIEEIHKAVESNKKIRGTVTDDGDKLDWCIYFNYKSM